MEEPWQKGMLRLHPASTAQQLVLSHHCHSALPGSYTSNLLSTTKPRGGFQGKTKPGTKDTSRQNNYSVSKRGMTCKSNLNNSSPASKLGSASNTPCFICGP